MSINVLFLCTGNSCRSQIAEGFAKQIGEDVLLATSAGTDPVGINPRSIETMEEIGIDISNQVSKNISELDIGQLDVVVSVCGDAREQCPVLPLRAKRIHWPIPDPAKATGSEEEIREAFRSVRSELQARVVQLVETIRTSGIDAL